MTDKSDEKDYSATLFLPQTDFPMRAGLPQKEPELLKRWFGILDGGPARITLGGGQAETMPFEAMLVFVTDLAPAGAAEARPGAIATIVTMAVAHGSPPLPAQAVRLDVAMPDGTMRRIVFSGDTGPNLDLGKVGPVILDLAYRVAADGAVSFTARKASGTGWTPAKGATVMVDGVAVGTTGAKGTLTITPSGDWDEAIATQKGAIRSQRVIESPVDAD